MATAVSAQSQVGLSRPLPEPEQGVASGMEDDATVQSAIRFLQDARVQRSPIESQIRFLKGKGLTDRQIACSFAKVGRAVTEEAIASIRVPASNTTPPAAAASGRGTPLSSQLKTARQTVPIAMATGPQYTQTLFPHSPNTPQEEPQSKLLDWRDVVIGAGAAVLAGLAGCKMFNRYSSYEFRRKSEKKARLHRSTHSRHRPANTASSESDVDASSTRHRGRVPPLPPPPPPLPPVAAAAAAEPITSATPPNDLAEKANRLQIELDETKEALANERRKCADLAVSAAKIRADKQQLSRTNDRLSQQIDGLKKEIEKLTDEKNATAGESALNTEGITKETLDVTAVHLPSPAPMSSAGLPTEDVVPLPPTQPSHGEPIIVIPSPVSEAPVTLADQAEPIPVALDALAPEGSFAATTAPVLPEDSTVPDSSVTGVEKPLIPTTRADAPKACDDTSVSGS